MQFQRPKSVEHSLNDNKPVADSSQNKSLSRFNSVKRKQLERLRQRSDWFLKPSANGSSPMQLGSSLTHLSYEHERLNTKVSGNSVTKASSEGAALDILSSDADSVFSDESRCESPASEPIRTSPIKVTRDIIHSDPVGHPDDLHPADVTMEDMTEDPDPGNNTDQEMHDAAEVCYFVVEHKYGDSES